MIYTWFPSKIVPTCRQLEIWSFHLYPHPSLPFASSSINNPPLSLTNPHKLIAVKEREPLQKIFKEKKFSVASLFKIHHIFNKKIKKTRREMARSFSNAKTVSALITNKVSDVVARFICKSWRKCKSFI